MGSFDQSCVVSRLPISHYRGEKCYVLPIKKNEYTELNSGPFCNYSPLCLPIEGEYNDYGNLENIVKNDHTKFLEEYFGLSIEHIVSCITDCRKRYGVEYTQYGSLMEALGCNFSDISKENLVKMKFNVSDSDEVTHEIVDNNVKINNGAFDTDQYKTDVDAAWIGIEKDVKFFLKKNTSDYPKYVVEVYVNGVKTTDLQDIGKVCDYFQKRRTELKKNQKSYWSNKFFIFGASADKKIQDRLHILHSYEATFIKKEVYDQYSELSKNKHEKYEHTDFYRKKLIENVEMLTNLPAKMAVARQFMDEWHKKTKDEKDDARETEEQKSIWHKNYEISDPHRVVENCSLVRSFGRYDNIYFDDRHGDELKYGFKESFIPEFIKFHHFMAALFSTNSIIFPAHSLAQDGDRNAQMEYLKIVEKILESEIKENSEEYGD